MICLLQKIFREKALKCSLLNNYTIKQLLLDHPIQLHCTVNVAKLTCFEFPYPITLAVDFEKTIKIPDLRILAAMKAFALGERVKWNEIKGYLTEIALTQF